ncbi:MAG: hypothetical protein ACXWUD_09650 [Methylosarcina sp.]
MVKVSSWGRLGSWEHEIRALTDRHQVTQQLKSTRPGIAYGMGRSYGDACLNPDGVLWNTTGLDRFISFDESTGRLVCEAGTLLQDIQRLAILFTKEIAHAIGVAVPVFTSYIGHKRWSFR